jgi:hypothetical protein
VPSGVVEGELNGRERRHPHFDAAARVPTGELGANGTHQPGGLGPIEYLTVVEELDGSAKVRGVQGLGGAGHTADATRPVIVQAPWNGRRG